MILFKLLFDFLRDKTSRGLVISTFAIVFTGTFVYHFVEGWRWLDSLYFSVITLATVGYGDFSPQTDFGKVFTIFYILMGIGIIFGFINSFYLHSKSNIREKKENRNKKRNIKATKA